MNTATIALTAAWNVIVDQDLPAHTKATVEDGRVIILPRDGQPIRVPYSPTDTLDSIYSALKDAIQAGTQDNR